MLFKVFVVVLSINVRLLLLWNVNKELMFSSISDMTDQGTVHDVYSCL